MSSISVRVVVAIAWAALIAGCASAPAPAPVPAAALAAADDPQPRVQICPLNPWTHLAMNNDPRQFQFAIVADRTGGHRPGVFADAVGKLNLLQPEFVLSVGDLIEGYTDDPAVIEAQWAEVNESIRRLEMPFFYVPGNHDISNETMAADWRQRYGQSYYHFVYRDVLFLCLNTEDRRPEGLTEAQLEYVRTTLAANAHVRWTLLFMHKPLWDYPEECNWPRVEAMLQGRPHTVIAGHYHGYMKERRHDADYLVLATTGGVSGLRGRLFGEFDHVVWVTMTDRGPRIANLMLDGIWDANVRTAETATLVHSILAGAAITAEPVFVAGPAFARATTRLRLRNGAGLPMEVAGTMLDNATLVATPATIAVTVPPDSALELEVQLEARSPGARVDDLQPAELSWQTRTRLADGQLLTLDGTTLLAVERHLDCPAGKPKRVDGDLGDWDELPIACVHPAQVRGAPASWQGADDLSFRFGVEYSGEFLYIGVQVTDERQVLRPGFAPWEQDGIEVRLDARPDSVRADNRGEGERQEFLLVAVSPGAAPAQMSWYERAYLDSSGVQVVSLTTPAGHQTEIAVPLAWLDRARGAAWDGFRLNIAVDDYDDPAGPLAQVWWKPRWGSPQDYRGSGMFVRR